MDDEGTNSTAKRKVGGSQGSLQIRGKMVYYD
jgi:hypothetical protein